jgi:hypothetical protein
MKNRIVKLADALSGVSRATWVVLATILLTIINAVLTMLGHNPIVLADAEITKYVSWALMFASVGFGIWKNISFTKGAQTTDEVLKLIKQGLVTADEVQKYVQEVKEKKNSSQDANVKTMQTEQKGL